MSDKNTAFSRYVMPFILLFLLIVNPIFFILGIVGTVMWSLFKSPSRSQFASRPQDEQNISTSYKNATHLRLSEEEESAYDLTDNLPYNQEELPDYSSGEQAKEARSLASDEKRYAKAGHISAENLGEYVADRCTDEEHTRQELKDLLKAGIIEKDEYRERLAQLQHRYK